VGSWRALVIVWAQALACYHPSAALDMPCAANGDCPTGQTCDLGQMTCVGSGNVIGDAAIDAPAPHDAPAPRDAPPALDAATPAIAFRQAVASKPTDADLTMALPHAVQPGDAIVVCLNIPATQGVDLSAVTDSLGNHYDVVVTNVFGDGQVHYVAAAYDALAGVDTLALKFTGQIGSGGTDWFALEYAGLAGSDAFDVSAAMTGSGTMMFSGAATTHAGNELIVGYAEAPGASPSTNDTERITQSGNLVEDRVEGSAGSYGAGATTTAGNWTMIMAAFRGQ
jgi:hypothetical protein